MASTAVHRATWVERARTLAFCLLALLVAGSLGVLWATPADAATFTVNSTADTGDATLDGRCDTCTLREAIQEANANNNDPTVDLINFAIQGAEPHTISPASSGLPDIEEPLTINGYSQPGASPNTLAVGNNAVLKIELSGAAAPTNTSGLKIKAAKSTVKGLVINNWENGVFLDTGAASNLVTGNYVGTDATGTTDKNGADDLGNNIGVVAKGTNDTIGGTTAAARNIISGNDGFGVNISGGTNTKVMGNYIGTKKDGTSALSNNYGVVIESAPNNTIGGTTAAARNIISGNTLHGILIRYPGATGNTVQGNIINGNGQSGVEILFESSFDPPPPTGNRILSNSIYDNGTLGIDLVHSNDPAGVTQNDDGDNDGGPNLLQNFPVITSARTSRRATTIVGTLDSAPSTTFTLQFFSNLQADPSGFGEGQRFKAQKSVTTDGAGDDTFSFKLRRGKKIPVGQFVTATATDPQGNTSEFSAAVEVSSP